ncbi:hypothetical protein J2Z21_008884 [Streptomyces griseochromogenes]|uniref:Uncharacterized protein n=1 Tax=Streptomyces griseochromogenes TaxID=68214 RepID=A0A1B1AZK8_9ACTN|nr:hypothetical protein [Streptomyces griseochromogenes]ANP52016.1 hypothetical protein AVL59_22730 [Streptomyces griseochromogenes]MBP2055868.1 hypothetical protein [Streptomyces griseochromogenes]
MPHHALEITLTQALDLLELDTARHRMPLAANHDTTRLIALIDAKTPHRAARRLRHQLGGLLPIDVITTHYPDAEHKALLNVAFPPHAHAAMKAEARRTGLPPERFVELAVHRALTSHAEQEIDRLSQDVHRILARTTPAHLLAAVGHALTRLPKDDPTP